MSQKNVMLTVLLLVAGGLLLAVITFIGSSEVSESGKGDLLRTGQKFQATFSEMQETTVEGKAVVRPVEDGLVVSVNLRGLDSGKRYNTHYHRGTCHQPGGGGVQLNPVIADDAGAGTSTTELAYESINPTFDHLIMIHKPDQKHVLCASTPRIEKLKSISPDSN